MEVICKMESKFEQFALYEFNNWKLYMHENQCYLGRMYALHKSSEDVDILSLNNSDFSDLHKVVVMAKTALDSIFFPDRFNYAVLGNVFQRLHLHIIPRYKTARFFKGIQFVDENWGKNYAPYSRQFVLEEAVMCEIKMVLKEGICKNQRN